MNRTRTIGTALILSLALAGCESGGKETPPVVTGKSLAALQVAEGCGDVLAMLKARTVDETNKLVDQNLQYALDMVEHGCMMYAMEDAAPTAGQPGGASNGNESAKSYSKTNTQVEGVDEADFIKNDGSFLYVLADNKLQILDAWPAPQTHRIAAVDIKGKPKRMFVDEDRAVVYSQVGPIQTQNSNPYGYYGGYSGGNGGDCSYGYDCEFTGDGQLLQITVFDIKDRTAPKLVREIAFSGSYLNSRRINDIIHTVVVFPEVTVPGVNYWPEEMGNLWDSCWKNDYKFPFTAEQVILLFAKLKIENAAKVQAAGIAQFLPGVKDTRYVNGQPFVEEGLLADCKGFFLSQAGDGQNFLSLVSFEQDELGPLGLTTIVGKPGAVYASADSLYVADRHYLNQMSAWYFETSEGIQEATTIHKFRLNPDSVKTSYFGSGVVKGRVLNQFAMDEHHGHLRIATTVGHLPNPDAYNTVHVLAEGNHELIVSGLIDHIAPSEDIRSARFDGDQGYIVTFKKTDPLFVLDLKDPQYPKIAGELKIPGFSTYIHLMEEGYLLSIGYDADDQGSFAWFQGIMLQIFDVHDMADPKLVHKEVIGTRGSTSEAATNHLAFNYFRDKHMLAIPMTICLGGTGGQHGDQMAFSGLLVYKVTTQDGFKKLGGVPHAAPEAAPDYYNSACGNWWTQSNSVVQRSVFMEDWVYSVAYDLIQVASVADLEHPVQSIVLDPK